MTQVNQKQKPAFGYLSAVHSAEHGYFGGYLIVSPLGRPLEFHCTAPVLPSRAQQILYGSTLEPYLLGEQIGRGLIAAAKLSPRLVLTDFAQFEAIKEQISVPLVLISGKPRPGDCGGPANEVDAAARGCTLKTAVLETGHPAWSHPFLLCNHRLQLPLGAESQRDLVGELLATLTERVELTEPFERIHEAIREAQRIGARGAESHGQAA